MYTEVNGLEFKNESRTLFFSITDKVGGLDECLKALKGANISLTRIESRPSKTTALGYDFFVDLSVKNKDSEAPEDGDEMKIREAVENLKKISIVDQVHLVGKTVAGVEEEMPWFPRKMIDLDTFAEKVLEMGEELSSDHPGANDPVYRKRRMEITALAKKYKSGMKLPHIEYTQVEKDTWRTVYTELKRLYQTHACSEHRHIFPLLEKNCGYGPDNIPQIEDVSNFLKDCTGFTLRPVMGLLSSRDFLNAFAFRVFHSTQYIRHHSDPFYTPEPDVCHELLGHAPLLADPDFAEFCQEIGLASLGANDEEIKKLATIFWFTIEFGLCKEGGNGEIRAYGAGLLSSVGELQYALSEKPKLLELDPKITSITEYPITSYQPTYFVANSFKEATMQVRKFAETMSRKFEVSYNAYTQTVEVLDSKEKIMRFANEIKANVQVLTNAISKV